MGWDADFAKNIRAGYFTTNPVVYGFLFKANFVEKLCAVLPVKLEKLFKVRIDSEDYFLLYSGKAKNGKDRIRNWHILDKGNNHDVKKVSKRWLSVLRQSVSAFEGLKMSDSQSAVNQLIDENCIVIWHEVSAGFLDAAEKIMIDRYYLPLNDRGNKSIDSTHRSLLRKIKDKYRY